MKCVQLSLMGPSHFTAFEAFLSGVAHAGPYQPDGASVQRDLSAAREKY